MEAKHPLLLLVDNAEDPLQAEAAVKQKFLAILSQVGGKCTFILLMLYVDVTTIGVTGDEVVPCGRILIDMGLAPGCVCGGGGGGQLSWVDLIDYHWNIK